MLHTTTPVSWATLFGMDPAIVPFCAKTGQNGAESASLAWGKG
jgi:hypothetical protein